MAAWRYEISLLVLKNISVDRSLRSIVKYFSTLEEKFRITARPCNTFFLLSQGSSPCHYPTQRLETSHAQ